MADSLVKKGAKRWVDKNQTPLLVSCVAALGASAATANPIPIVAWAVATGLVGFFRITSDSYLDSLGEEHRSEMERKESQKFAQRTDSIWRKYEDSRVQRMVENGEIPNYRRVYDRLVHILGRVKQRADDREDVSALSEAGMEDRMRRMLENFLSFVAFRVDVIFFLGELAENEAARGKSLRLTGRVADRFKLLLDNIDRRIAEMRAGAPSTSRLSHISLLVKKQDNIRKVAERDAQVAEQLDAFLDIYDSIFAQYNQERFEQGEVDEYVKRTINDMERVEKSVNELRPFMNDLSELA